MFAILIIIVDLIATVLGVYLFDYRIDGVVNDLFIIILCILAGILIATLFVVIVLETFYYILPKKSWEKSMIAHKIVKQIVSVPIHFSNMTIKIVGKENLPKEHGFSIYVNHTSWIDIPIIMYKLTNQPVAALGKVDAFKIPMIGKFAPKLGCVMIDRSDARQGAKAIKHVVTNIKNGFSMIIFPEGTRNPNPSTVLDFKHGAFKAALRSEKPLVPMTIVKPKNFKEIKWPFRKRITLVIHPPLQYSEFEKMKTSELSSIVKKAIGNPLG